MSKRLLQWSSDPDLQVERRWPVTSYPLALKATVAVHAIGFVGWAIVPAMWPWWLAGVALNHVVVTAAGLWPRSRILGTNWTRLPDIERNANAIALTIDDGPDPVVTPQVLDLLDVYSVKATFFLIGERARRHPALTREIVARGHKVENHTQRHVHTFSVRGMPALAREIDAAQRTLTELTGDRPAFFRAPAGLRNVLLEPVLQQLDLRLAAWTKRGFDTRERDPEIVAQRLLKDLAARDILLLHDADAAITNDGQPILLSVLPRVINEARQRGLQFVTLREAF